MEKSRLLSLEADLRERQECFAAIYAKIAVRKKAMGLKKIYAQELQRFLARLQEQ